MTSLTELCTLVGLQSEQIMSLPSGGGNLDLPELEIDPYEFLLRAEDDWELGNESAELNAITNAKRAVVCQMDQALLSFGYPATKWNIPKKIDALNDLGLVAPRILRRVASARNLLEHEYRRPTKAQVEDALDLAALFVASIKPVLQVFGHEFVVGNREEQLDQFSFSRGLYFSMRTMETGPPLFQIAARVLVGDKHKKVGALDLTWKDSSFPTIVRLALATDRGFKQEKALENFRKLAKLESI